MRGTVETFGAFLSECLTRVYIYVYMEECTVFIKDYSSMHDFKYIQHLE